MTPATRTRIVAQRRLAALRAVLRTSVLHPHPHLVRGPIQFHVRHPSGPADAQDLRVKLNVSLAPVNAKNVSSFFRSPLSQRRLTNLASPSSRQLRSVHVTVRSRQSSVRAMRRAIQPASLCSTIK
jgi:hypothetical protein